MTKQARLFISGGSQAVRLPAEFRFADVDAVYVRRNAAGDVVLSRQGPRSYASFMAIRDALGHAPDDFLSASERDQRSQPRDPFAGVDGDREES